MTLLLGALATGHLIVLPEISAPDALLDANLAKALARPIHLRLSEAILAASLLLTAVVGAWLNTKLATVASFVLVITASLHRFVVLPALYTAWSRADLVAARPVERIAEAERLVMQEQILAAAMALLALGLLAGASWRSTAAPGVPDETHSAPIAPVTVTA
jgi:hypothetical protein